MEGCQVTIEAEAGVMQLQAKEHQRASKPPEARKRQEGLIPIKVLEGAQAC